MTLLLIASSFTVSFLAFLLLNYHQPPMTPEEVGTSSMQMTWVNKTMRFIYIKTFKTGSTTLGGIFFRFGLNNHLRFWPSPSHRRRVLDLDPTLVKGARQLTIHHHVLLNPLINTSNLMWYYQQVVPGGHFVTILREPLSRLISAYNYFYLPSEDKGNFEAFLRSENKEYLCHMSNDLAINNLEQLDRFMKDHYSQFFFLILEHFDESLLLMKNRFGWSLEDILYIPIQDSCNGTRPFDKKRVGCDKSMLADPTLLERARDINYLDQQLYDRARADLERTLELQPASFWRELATFKAMLVSLRQLCKGQQQRGVPAECQVFLMNDLEYENAISPFGTILKFSPVRITYGPS